MAVFRVAKNRNYTCMSNTHLRDKNLSLKAKGLLSVILSLPDEWNYSIEGLVSICKEEQRAVTAALNELKSSRYLVVSKLPPQQGHNKYSYIYDVFEEPQNEGLQNVGLQNVDVQSEGVQNGGLYKVRTPSSTEGRNTESGNKEIRASQSDTGVTRVLQSGSKNVFETQIEAFTVNEELRQSLRNFVEHRKQIRKPLTENAMKLLLKKLGELSGNAAIQIEILQQSIINGWAGVFGLKRDSGKASQDARPRGYQEEPKRLGQTIL